MRNSIQMEKGVDKDANFKVNGFQKHHNTGRGKLITNGINETVEKAMLEKKRPFQEIETKSSKICRLHSEIKGDTTGYPTYGEGCSKNMNLLVCGQNEFEEAGKTFEEDSAGHVANYAVCSEKTAETVMKSRVDDNLKEIFNTIAMGNVTKISNDTQFVDMVDVDEATQASNGKNAQEFNFNASQIHGANFNLFDAEWSMLSDQFSADVRWTFDGNYDSAVNLNKSRQSTSKQQNDNVAPYPLTVANNCGVASPETESINLATKGHNDCSVNVESGSLFIKESTKEGTLPHITFPTNSSNISQIDSGISQELHDCGVAVCQQEQKSRAGTFNDDNGPKNLWSTVIVNYLPQGFSDDDLFFLFSTFGDIKSVRIIRDKNSGYSFGYGFVNFMLPESAEASIKSLNGTAIGCKTLKVSYARENSEDIRQTNLYITNIPRTFVVEDLENLFKPFGNILHRRLLRDKYTNLPRGIAFVRYEKKSEAHAAISALNKYEVPGSGCKLQVDVAENRGKERAAYAAGFKAGYGQGSSSWECIVPRKSQSGQRSYLDRDC